MSGSGIAAWLWYSSPALVLPCPGTPVLVLLPSRDGAAAQHWAQAELVPLVSVHQTRLRTRDASNFTASYVAIAGPIVFLIM